MELSLEARDLIVRQSGVVACWQAKRLGLSAEAFRNRLRRGDWQRLHHGVYATFTGRPDREAQLWGALLRAGPDAVLSHHTAAERHGLLARPSTVIHVAVPSGHNPARGMKISGLVVHRSDSALVRRHPAMTPPCTRVEDTVLDLIRMARTADEAYDWVCKALGQRRTTAERIRAALMGCPRPDGKLASGTGRETGTWTTFTRRIDSASNSTEPPPTPLRNDGTTIAGIAPTSPSPRRSPSALASSTWWTKRTRARPPQR